MSQRWRRERRKRRGKKRGKKRDRSRKAPSRIIPLMKPSETSVDRLSQNIPHQKMKPSQLFITLTFVVGQGTIMNDNTKGRFLWQAFRKAYGSRLRL
jgi:hypothetical protein